MLRAKYSVCPSALFVMGVAVAALLGLKSAPSSAQTLGGTILSNIANSSQLEGATNTFSISNEVQAVVKCTFAGPVAPVPAGSAKLGASSASAKATPACPFTLAPLMFKDYSVHDIAPGGSTQLRFTILNISGNPLQNLIGFTDTLPASLKLTAGATATISGAGCTGSVTLTAPGTITVSNLSMALGTAQCIVAVDSVTNVTGQLNPSCASNPAAFTNGPANITGLSNLNNDVTPQCVTVSVPAVSATLTKAFGSTTIDNGQNTTLEFTLTNVVGNPAITGMAFTDTLPAGLRLSPTASAAVVGAGCTGNISLAQPGTIAATGLNMAAGTLSCTVVISGITNVVGQANADCAAFPPAFTNGSSNLSGLTKLTNSVTNQCLVVRSVLIGASAPKCVMDAPYVDYAVTPVGVSGAGGVTIVWEKMDGTVVSTLPGQPLTGTLLWPGAAVAPSGQGIAWPGWQFVSGNWVQIADGLRPQMRIRFQINPTNDVVVNYPPATPTCNTNPPTIAPPASPTLTKAFVSSEIVPGASTQLSFAIANSAGNLPQAGVGFTDTLPIGLQLAAAASASVVGAGCSGSVALVPPRTINVTNLAIQTGVSSCGVLVNGITNASGQTNASCAASPANFTNASSNISGLSNLTNAVTSACLVVRAAPAPPVVDPATSPVLTKSFQKPYIVDGDWTDLTFNIEPKPNTTPLSGLGFQDLLPQGLAFRWPTAVTFNGCTGTATFSTYMPPQLNMIEVRNIFIPKGSTLCSIRVEAVTNRIGRLNPTDCGAFNAPDFTNSPERVIDTGTILNAVTPQCLRVLPALPSLTKQFGVERIYENESTTLTFTLRNSPGNPAQTDGAFRDTLPSGLRLAPGATAQVQGAGCAGNVQLNAPADIDVSGLAFTQGTSLCKVIVSAVTNVAGQLNTSCSATPAAFTNAASSISRLANVLNFVDPACLAIDALTPSLDMAISKSMTIREGYSPSGTYTVSMTATNAATGPDARKREVVITDALPPGMILAAGSLRVAIGSSSFIADAASGTANLAGRSVGYQTTPSSVEIRIPNLEPTESVSISFAVSIAPNLSRDSQLVNTAQLQFLNSADRRLGRSSNAVIFRVLGALDVSVTGQTIDAAEPGAELAFRNIITNRGNLADTYDILLTGSTYPQGSVIRLFDSDGATSLADTSGNGVPDTGILEPGASKAVIVKVLLPAGQPVAGPFRVTKLARSTRNRSITAADDDVLSGVSQSCRLVLEPDNRGSVRAGATITYFHLLTNIGNCIETITNGSVTGTSSGWINRGYLNIPSNAGGVTAGVAGSGNPGVSEIVVLAPGETKGYLVEVTAPTAAQAGDTNTSTLSLTSTGAVAKSAATKQKDAVAVPRTLTNRDVTTVNPNAANDPTDVIRPFVDVDFRRPTFFGFIGQTLFIRATAPSCNAVPDVIERRTVIITGPNGEREELVAIETGPNTGIFDTSIPIRRPPVTASNTFLEGNAYDTFLLEIVGCGRRIATSVTLIDPNGVVFDSRTNEPVAGATVRLVTASAGVCTTTLATVQVLNNGNLQPSRNPIVSGSDGRFDFPLVEPGDYCLQVQPPNGYTWISTVSSDQLPRARNILATGPTSGGSYGGAFRVGPETGPVIVDIPVDPGRIDGLFIKKEALRPIVELGEFVDYTVTIANRTGYDLAKSNVFATDDLPAGFTYVKGTTRIDGRPVDDPAGGGGPRLVFDLGQLKVAQLLKLTYRVRVGAGALQGDGVNRVVATYRLNGQRQFSESNVASAKVQVTAGVFTNRAYVIGKVFADCNRDGMQSRGSADNEAELGIPGIRLMMEDGTSAITDAEGKFSFYGLLPRTHVLKVDRSTLPEGVRAEDFELLSNRNLGKGDSRVLDLKNGEMHRANFAVRGCSLEAVTAVEKRRRAASSLATEVDGRLQQRLTTDAVVRPVGDTKALPAMGTIGQVEPPINAASTPVAQSQVGPPTSQLAQPTAAVTNSGAPNSFNTLAEPMSKPLEVKRLERKLGDVAAPNSQLELEDVLPKFDNTLGFIGVNDGDVLPYAQTAIRVKGTAGSTLRLIVNGATIPDTKVGKRAVLEEKQLQGWEFIGVDLQAGVNEIVVKQFDQFGNARGEKNLQIKAPGDLAKIGITFEDKVRAQGGGIADGRTPVRVIVSLTDKFGTPVTNRVPLTLFANVGRWDVVDVNPVEPGVQVFVEGGKGEFSILPPTEPSQAKIAIDGGRVKSEAALDFLPDLRDMIAAGVIEGVLNLRKLDSRALQPAREQDSFEREISHLSQRWNNGKNDRGIRAAMFIKGKVKGEYLLTLAYDSDKDTQERLFRDIQPDEFYPIYGDSSVRAFDAQSTGRFYVRVDHRKSYLLYGDYNTAVAQENRLLSNYNRSLTGIKQHYETKQVSANVFASRDSTKQVIDEFPANGTSGPFTLSTAKGLVNSEKIEILVRDRNRASIILRATPLARFVDYEIEPLTGRILLKAPVASLDELLNPQSIRVTYEVDQAGEQFWVSGADVQVKLTDRIELGGVVVDDRNPADKFRMMGLNSVTKIAEKTFVIAELVRTTRDKVLAGETQSAGEVGGNAKRVEIKHRGTDLEARLFIAKADAGFDNPSASITKGRTEAGGKLSYRLGEKSRLTGELLSSSDNLTGAKRDGVLLSIERSLGLGLRVEAGVRHARDTQPAQLPGNSGTSGIAPKQEVTTLRTRLTGEVGGIKGLSAYGEAEVDVQDSQRKILALGGDYQLPNKGRLYARHEFISSITGPYGLSTQQRQNATVVGLNTEYMKDGNLFSEYRVRDAISGGDAEAALGLRNTWKVSEGVNLQTGFERVHALSGLGNAESTALTFGVEYTANPLWKGSSRLELREGKSQDSILSTFALASKLGRDWTFLGRNTYSLMKNKGESKGENKQERLQFGLAYRDTDTDVWNALGKVEHRAENDTMQPEVVLKRTVEMVSIHANWQPRKPFTFSGRYAAKRVNENSNGLASKTNAQLIGGRAIWEVAPRWDVSLNASTLFSQGKNAKQYGLGVELGYMVMENLWLSAGYNWFGYKDADLTASDYTNKGVFVRLRYKFDEDLFAAKPKSDVVEAGRKSDSAAISTSTEQEQNKQSKSPRG